MGATAPSLSPQSAQDLWQWLWAVRQASSANRAMLPTHHPGTFRAGRWTCCLHPAASGRAEGLWTEGGGGGPLGKGPPAPRPRLSSAAPGCSRSHSSVALGEWTDPLDPAAAAQTLYGHLRRAGVPLR